MIDDLTTRGVTEPYRMFTSRAEFRLSLRADNADQRLTPIAIQLGCVSSDRTEVFLEKLARLERVKAMLTATTYTPKQVASAGIQASKDGNRRTAFQLLSFPDVSFEDLIPLDSAFLGVDPETRRQVERDALYSNYIDRQQKDIERLRKDEAHLIPGEFNYSGMEGLSNELKLKLTATRPETLAQAARIDGITPAALTLILAHLRRDARKKAG
jgi:tRNA uridine 5-carboxymethylaminomethyl modification enzyme